LKRRQTAEHLDAVRDANAGAVDRIRRAVSTEED
jgi:hypothetical protein